MKYKIGDKVCYKHKKDSDNVDVGEVGTIRGFSSNGNYAVDFETDDPYRHDCGGRCNSFHGWWCSEDTLESVADGGFCTGFRGGKIPTPEKPIPFEEQVREAVKHTANITGSSYETIMNAFNAFGCSSFKVSPGELEIVMKRMEEKKMPTKFTFYTVDTSRINKTNNTKVDTIMTCVHIGDKVGYATCDKEDYDEREGILNAIANLCCDGSFDKAYRKAVKEKKISETLDCTCSYCRKVFDTVEERQEHEAWHIECRKARHQRYLLRKRAKEIAFEEAAQKMAKEMIGEQK